jgi:heme/copper-type cytochrome/quinol oxidase subunit 2
MMMMVVMPMAVIVIVVMVMVVMVVVKAHASLWAEGSAMCSAMLARSALMWASAAE